MKAEILVTGKEILTGAVLDSNSATIAGHLEEIGIEVTRHMCTGDDMDSLVQVLEEISHRADIAIVTGGLGPTPDDITAEAAAAASDSDLVLDPAALASVKAFFEKRQILYSESNRKQALLPAGARALPNPIGSAPGFVHVIDRCRYYYLPGVPAEMQHMLRQTVIPELEALMQKAHVYRRVAEVTTFGLTEAATAETLSGFEQVFPDVKLGLRARFPEIHVRLYGSGSDAAGLVHQMNEAKAWIQKRLGVRVLSTEGQSMAAVVGALLRQLQATIAVAESCTGGLVSHLLTNIAGSSDYFLFSGVTYANDAKVKVLGVAPRTLATFGAVHPETAREMAAGVQRLSNASYGLSTTGIAGPSGGTETKPVGTVCIGLAGPDGAVGRRYHFPFEQRGLNKKIFAVTALDVLRKALMKKMKEMA